MSTNGMRWRLGGVVVGSLLLGALALACAKGAVTPAELDGKGNDWCAGCRMAVTDLRFAAQLLLPGEEPKFFDDIGCMRRYVANHAPLPEGAAAFVADHRTRKWVPAQNALYTRVMTLETPMSSHLIAHADAASRDADPDARTGTPVAANELLGPQLAAGTPP